MMHNLHHTAMCLAYYCALHGATQLAETAFAWDHAPFTLLAHCLT